MHKRTLIAVLLSVIFVGLFEVPAIAKQEPQKASKKAASKLDPESEKKLRKYFKSWFDKFYSKLYYANDPEDVSYFYTLHCRQSMKKHTGSMRQHTMRKLKDTYIGKPKITKLVMYNPRFCDVKVEGNISVNRYNGVGYCIYRMIKEGETWRIDSAATRGMYHGRGLI